MQGGICVKEVNVHLQQSRLPGGRQLSSWCKKAGWEHSVGFKPKMYFKEQGENFWAYPKKKKPKKERFLTAWTLILSSQYFACAFGKYFYSVTEDAQNCNLFSKMFRSCCKRSQEGKGIYPSLLFSEKITLESDDFSTLPHRLFWGLFLKCSESFSVQNPLPEILPSILEEVCCFQNNLPLAVSVLAQPKVTPWRQRWQIGNICNKSNLFWKVYFLEFICPRRL